MLTELWNHGLPLVQWGAVLGASLAAAVMDMRYRRIPNWLTLPLWVGGLAWSCASAGLPACGDALLASVALAAPYVWLYLYAGGGAGDAKMMAALGAWLGMANGLALLVGVAVAAVVLGVAYSIIRRRTRELVTGVVGASLRLASSISELPPDRSTVQATRGQTMPYGLAIFIGAALTAAGVFLWRL